MSSIRERNLAVAVGRERHVNALLIRSLRAAEAREASLREALVEAEERATRLAKRNADLEEQVRDAERLLVQHRWAARHTPEEDTDG